MPIERYISNFYHDVPIPHAGFPPVKYTIGYGKIDFIRPPAMGLPLRDVSACHMPGASPFSVILWFCVCVCGL